MKVLTLKKRKDFIRAANGYKVATNGLVLQAAFSLCKKTSENCFVGYTATKKIGKAVVRSFAKRRLREIARKILQQNGIAGVSYVFIARHNTTTLNFAYMMKKAEAALDEINNQILADKRKNVEKDDDPDD